MCCLLFGQDRQTVSISFLPVYGNKRIDWHDSTYASQNAGSVKFEVFKLYISNIRFFKNDSLAYSRENNFYLLDAGNPSSLKVRLTDVPLTCGYTVLKFDIGIDSLTNVSGAMRGSLDPTNGMYWTWQSGYINAKLEGSCSLCPSRKNEFQFHIGGYQQPFYALRTKTLRVDGNRNITIRIDLEHFFNTVNVTGRDHVMSPSADAVKLSGILSDCFITDKK